MTPFAILCPGQGAQTSAIFDLVIDDPDAAAVIERFSIAAGLDLVARTACGDGLHANAYAQPAIVASAVATWALLKPRLPPPAMFAGYSVGEVSAWACAGAWSVADTASIIAGRARSMDDCGPHDCGMLAVRGLSRDEVERCASGLFVAIVNAADQVVLAGPNDALDDASPAFVARGASVRRLDVHVPSHTPLMREAAARFATDLAWKPARDPSSAVLRGVDGAPCRRGADAVPALSRAIDEPIRWDACLRALAEAGIGVALELGPGHALADLCAAQYPDIVVRSVAQFRSVDGVVDWMMRRLD